MAIGATAEAGRPFFHAMAEVAAEHTKLQALSAAAEQQQLEEHRRRRQERRWQREEGPTP